LYQAIKVMPTVGSDLLLDQHEISVDVGNGRKSGGSTVIRGGRSLTTNGLGGDLLMISNSEEPKNGADLCGLGIFRSFSQFDKSQTFLGRRHRRFGPSALSDMMDQSKHQLYNQAVSEIYPLLSKMNQEKAEHASSTEQQHQATACVGGNGVQFPLPLVNPFTSHAFLNMLQRQQHSMIPATTSSADEYLQNRIERKLPESRRKQSEVSKSNGPEQLNSLAAPSNSKRNVQHHHARSQRTAAALAKSRSRGSKWSEARMRGVKKLSHVLTNCSSNIKDKHVCQYCRKQFPRSANLTRHLRTV
jgi:hypothetical protein